MSSDIFIERKRSGKKKKSGKKVKNSFNDSDKNVAALVVEEKLEDNLEKFAEELTIAENNTPITTNATSATTGDDNIDGKRNELVKAAEEGYISQKVEYIKKCGVKVIDKIYKSYEIKRKKDADIFLTDLIISQFCSILGGLDTIEDRIRN